MTSPRTLAAVWAAKTAAAVSQRLGRGGGTAISGLIGLRLQPQLVAELARDLQGRSVIITGTNGKTTTSSLIAETVRQAGLQPLANASGSNLMRGLASTLALAVDGRGALPDVTGHIGVFEVDEATVPQALLALQPAAIVFTNLFRDQLDRYGEVEAVASLWREMLSRAPSDLTLVLNADDPSIASLGEGRDGVVYFGVEDPRLDRGGIEHASDALSCRCGARLTYDVAYFGHVGHWRCEVCGRARPAPAVLARDIELRDGRSVGFRLETPAGTAVIEMALGGLYNVYNALAAAAAGIALGLPFDAIVRALTSSGAAFGRQEAFEVDGRRVDLFLGKNPAGLNQVISTLLLDEGRRALLIILNDGTADGRDISWIWDADFENAAGRFDAVVVAGTRAEEMALRLKYAEWDESHIVIEPDIPPALQRALTATRQGATLTIIPTYTAMLEVRALLAKRTGRASFWQESRRPSEVQR